MVVGKFIVMVGVSLLIASCAPMQTSVKSGGGGKVSKAASGASMADIKQWYWNMYGSESPYEYNKRQKIEAQKEATKKWYWKMYGKESPYYKR